MRWPAPRPDRRSPPRSSGCGCRSAIHTSPAIGTAPLPAPLSAPLGPREGLDIDAIVHGCIRRCHFNCSSLGFPRRGSPPGDDIGSGEGRSTCRRHEHAQIDTGSVLTLVAGNRPGEGAPRCGSSLRHCSAPGRPNLTADTKRCGRRSTQLESGLVPSASLMVENASRSATKVVMAKICVSSKPTSRSAWTSSASMALGSARHGRAHRASPCSPGSRSVVSRPG